MNKTLTVAVLVGGLALVWVVRRRRPALLSSTDASAVAALNRARIHRPLMPPEPVPGGDPPREDEDDLPGDVAEAALLGPSRRRLELRRRIGHLWRGDERQRLRGLELCGRMGPAAALPVLRRGLRDPHPRVVAEAAARIDRYRGRTRPVSATSQAPLPRNVARTR
jgi:hypothetical protein